MVFSWWSFSDAMGKVATISTIELLSYIIPKVVIKHIFHFVCKRKGEMGKQISLICKLGFGENFWSSRVLLSLILVLETGLQALPSPRRRVWENSVNWDSEDVFFPWGLPLRVKVTRLHVGNWNFYLKHICEEIFHNVRVKAGVTCWVRTGQN